MTGRHLEYLLHVPEIVHHIGKKDEIELLAALKTVNVSLDEREMRMPGSRAGYHRRRDLHAHAVTRLKRIQQVALAATEVKDARARRNQKPVDFGQPAPIIAAYKLPTLGTFGVNIPKLCSLFGVELLTRVYDVLIIPLE
jgi:hypothetical protein